MEFYKLTSPTTRQIFDAIINNEYVPLEKIQGKAKQVEILLKDYFCSNEIYVTFTNVTNTGGVPIFMGDDICLYEIASEGDEDFYDLSQDEQEERVELLGSYLRTYKEVFSI